MSSSDEGRTLTAEQLAKIEENRLKALARRKQVATMSSVDDVLNDIAVQAEQERALTLHVAETKECTAVLEDGSICSNCPVDKDLSEFFQEFICKSCKLQAGDRYKTISRGDAMTNYLATEDSLRVLPFQTKNNPHNPGWTPMKLYLKKHVLDIAVKRFGSLEAMEDEKKRRDGLKFERHLTDTQDLLSKQSAGYRDSLNVLNSGRTAEDFLNEGSEDTNQIVSIMDLARGKSKRKSDSNSSGKKAAIQSREAKRRKMVSDLVSCITGNKHTK